MKKLSDTLIVISIIENLFISFDTPTEALSYYDPFVGKVIDTVEGNETCMIITQKDVNESGVSYVKNLLMAIKYYRQYIFAIL